MRELKPLRSHLTQEVASDRDIEDDDFDDEDWDEDDDV